MLIDCLSHEEMTTLLDGCHFFIHTGDFKTYQCLADEWFLVGLCKTVQKHLQRCIVCQTQKATTTHPTVSYNPYLFRLKSRTKISLKDFPNLMGRTWLMIDRLTKYVNLLAVKHPLQFVTLFGKKWCVSTCFPYLSSLTRTRFLWDSFGAKYLVSKLQNCCEVHPTIHKWMERPNC